MSLDWGTLVFVAATALVVGAFIGTTGIGGVLLIPLLIAPGGLTVHQAAATTLASMLCIGILGTWMFLRRGSLDARRAWPVCAGAAFAGYLGAMAAAQIAPRPLALVIGALIVAAGVLILRPPPVLVRARGARIERWLLLAVGMVAGFGSGLSGAGGPIFSVPLMIALGFATLAAVGVAQALLIVAAVSGSLANLQADVVDIPALALITIFQLAGLSVGARLAHSLPVATLRRTAAWLCIAAGALMVLRALWGVSG